VCQNRERDRCADQPTLSTGNICKIGTDQSRYPLNPMLGLYATVTRQILTGEPEGGRFPEERITTEEAFRADTLNSAYGSFEEEIKGPITVGKRVDMVVLSENFLKVEPS